MNLTESRISEFQSGVLRHFREEGRDFPWRRTRDPWPILMSEIMLQQTRTETLLPRWPRWIGRFPDPRSLADAPLAEVLTLWKGLGYNRRALALLSAARRIVEDFGGAVPEGEKDLLSLPGVGRYTARAVRAFAFGKADVVLETNIRAVFLFYFFPDRTGVADREIEPYVAATLPPDNPRDWYYALMDYGAALKRREPNPGRRSAAYARQSKFEGSHRQVRAAVLHALAERGPLSTPELRELVEGALERAEPLGPGLEKAARELEAEGFLEIREGRLALRD